MNNIYRKIVGALLFIFASFSASAQQQDYLRLYRHFLRAAKFDTRFPREKVYLHLDNNAYVEGDTLWFKAYVMRASNLLPKAQEHILVEDVQDADGHVVGKKTVVVPDNQRDNSRFAPLSRVLYVDLLNVGGQLMERRLLQLDSLGQAHGEFELKLPIHSGYYEVRAYTREMTNWGPEACFSRVVPVFRRPPKLGDWEDLTINRPVGEDDMMPSHPRPLDFGLARDVRLSFYPEGGPRVRGVAQNIAYKLTDGRGAARTDTLQLYDGDRLLSQSWPLHEGMGRLTVPADADDVYVRVGMARFDLPLPSDGADYALSVLTDTASVAGAAAEDEDSDDDEDFSFWEEGPDSGKDDGGQLCVVVQQRPGVSGAQLLGVAITCREEVCYFDTISVSATAVELSIPRRHLRSGVNRVELFDATGRSLCRRLVWNTPVDTRARLEVRQNDSIYAPFSPIALEMRLADANGTPVQTTFSLSVRDAAGELVAPADVDIAADLLLSSELRGYVHRPQDYFAATPTAAAALDLLLQVQGWTANSFEVMDGVKPFRLREPIEDRLMLKGRVYKENNKRQPLAGQRLQLQMVSRAGAVLQGEVLTDSLGAFCFRSDVDFAGDWIAQFTTRDEKNKKRWSRIALDRWFDLEPRKIDFNEFELTPPYQYLLSSSQQQPLLFQWTDTIPRTVPLDLGEVHVKKQTRYRGLTGNRYTYNGGEKTGMRKADVFYNIEQEVERLKDAGESVVSIWQLLALLNNDFSYDHSTIHYQERSRAEERADTLAGKAVVQHSYKHETPRGRLDYPDPYWMADYLSYRGRKPKVVLLNNYADPHLGEDMIWVDEIKSAAFVFADSKWERLLPGEALGSGPEREESYAILLYSRPDSYFYRTRKGIDRRKVQGYTQPLTFYSPSYRGMDLPSPTDYRRTLYWNPQVQTDRDGQASAVFFSGARNETELRISIRGISPVAGLINYEQ